MCIFRAFSIFQSYSHVARSHFVPRSGQTIDSVVVHGEHVFLPGQLDVGMGWVRDPAGLQVVGFRSATFQAHHPDVVDVHYREPIVIYVDNSCCTHGNFLQMYIEQTHVT